MSLSHSRSFTAIFTVIFTVALCTAVLCVRPVVAEQLDAVEPVSPGEVGRSLATDSGCPTFSWGTLEGVETLQLMVYRFDPPRDDWSPWLTKDLPGSSTSWTPPLEECLPMASSFAWSLVAVTHNGAKQFSDPLFFETPSAPTLLEVGRALEVLQSWKQSQPRVSQVRERLGEDDGSTRRPSRSKSQAKAQQGGAGGSVALVGSSTDTGNAGTGVRGSADSAQSGSRGVSGQANAATGDVAGLHGSHVSPQGTAVLLEAPVGGELIRGTGAAGTVFSVDAEGNVIAAATISGDGRGLTNVDADTLGGNNASAFAPTAHLHDGSAIVSGEVGEPRIDKDLARDIEVLPIMLASDGSGSGLDADLLDGLHASDFVTGGQSCPAQQVLTGINPDGTLACGPPVLPFQVLNTVDETGTAGVQPSMAIGTDGLPIISYYDSASQDLKIAHCEDVLCSTAFVDTKDSVGNVGSESSIAIGADGLAVVSYYDATNQDLKVLHCNFVSCGTQSWKAVDTVGSVGIGSSIAIGLDGFPIISYYDATNQDLKVAHCEDVRCLNATLTTVDSAGAVGSGSSIAIGYDGLPVISYYDATNGDLKFAYCDDNECSSSAITTVDSAGNVGSSSSITISAFGTPMISYEDATNFDLKVADCGNLSCSSVTLNTVDSAGAVGNSSSIAIGNDFNPIISYWDETNLDLKVAHCTFNHCGFVTLVTLDSVGSVGRYSSITIGADGLPIVSYYDSSNGDLKFAHCANRFCQ